MMRQELWRESDKIRLCSLVNCWVLCEQYLLSSLHSWGGLTVHCRTGPADEVALWYWPGCGLVLLCKWERASSLSGLRPALTKNRLAGWVNYKSWAGPPEYQKVLNEEIRRQREGAACRTVTPAQADAYRHVALLPAGRRRTGPTSGTTAAHYCRRRACRAMVTGKSHNFT